MEKQLPLMLWSLIGAESGGAVLEEERTASYRRRADGRGRFSGTMVSRELPLQDGHDLFWLHLVVAPLELLFDASLTIGMVVISWAKVTELHMSSPIIVQ